MGGMLNALRQGAKGHSQKLKGSYEYSPLSKAYSASGRTPGGLSRWLSGGQEGGLEPAALQQPGQQMQSC